MVQTKIDTQELMQKHLNKKIYKVHIDISVKGQFKTRVIPAVVSVFADDEQEAKNIARHTTFTCNPTTVKMEMDFGNYRKEHGYV